MTQNLINFAALFSQYLIGALWWCLFMRAILSWFPVPPNKFSNFLREITNPMVRFFQKMPFSRIGMMDLSIIFAMLALWFLADILHYIFIALGANPGIYQPAV